MKYEKQDIDIIRSKTDLVSLFEADGHLLKKTGAKFKCLSPFNQEKTPSCHVDPEKQFFKCFSSGHGGDCFKYWMLTRKVKFPEALEALAERVNYSPIGQERHASLNRGKLFLAPAPKESAASRVNAAIEAIPRMDASLMESWVEGVNWLANNPQEQELLAQARGFSLETIAALVSVGKIGMPLHYGNRYTSFLVEKADGTPVGYHIRLPGHTLKQQGPKPMFVFIPKDTLNPPPPFFLGNLATAKTVIILEGQWDAMAVADSFMRAGEPIPDDICIVGIRGGNSWESLLYGAGLNPSSTIILCPDNDPTGSRWFQAGGFLEGLLRQGHHVVGIKVEDLPGLRIKDFNDAHRRQPLAIWEAMALIDGSLKREDISSGVLTPKNILPVQITSVPDNYVAPLPEWNNLRTIAESLRDNALVPNDYLSFLVKRQIVYPSSHTYFPAPYLQVDKQGMVHGVDSAPKLGFVPLGNFRYAHCDQTGRLISVHAQPPGGVDVESIDSFRSYRLDEGQLNLSKTYGGERIILQGGESRNIIFPLRSLDFYGRPVNQVGHIQTGVRSTHYKEVGNLGKGVWMMTNPTHETKRIVLAADPLETLAKAMLDRKGASAARGTMYATGGRNLAPTSLIEVAGRRGFQIEVALPESRLACQIAEVCQLQKVKFTFTPPNKEDWQSQWADFVQSTTTLQYDQAGFDAVMALVKEPRSLAPALG